MVLMVLDEAEEAARRERIVRGDQTDGSLPQADRENEERKVEIYNINDDDRDDEIHAKDVTGESAEVVGKHIDVDHVVAGKGQKDDCGRDEAHVEELKNKRTIEVSVAAYEDEEGPAARANLPWEAEEQDTASKPAGTAVVISPPSVDERILRKSDTRGPGESKGDNITLENTLIVEEREKKGKKKTRHRRRLSLVSTHGGEDGQLQPAVLVSLNDVIDRHCLSPLVLKSPVIPFGGLMDDSFAYAMIQAEQEDSPEKELQKESTACDDAASNGCSARQSPLKSPDYKEKDEVVVSWNNCDSHEEKVTSIPLHVYESDIAKMEEDFEKRMKRAEECWEQRYEQMRADNERSEQRIESLIRQSKVLEETSTSLGSQVMYLKSKLEKTEASLSEANKEMHIARMNGQTKMTTIENLTQQLQTVTIENCRLSRDKAGLEDNIRQLTSILQAMTAPDTSKAISALDENKNMLQVSEKLPSVAVHVTCHDEAFQNDKIGPRKEEQPLSYNDMMRTVEQNSSIGVEGPTDRAPFSPKNNNTEIMTKDRISPIRDFMDSGVTKQIKNPCSLNKGAEYQDNCFKRKETTSELEKELLQLNVEKEKLDIELSRMPFNSVGKTVAQRQRRKYVDSRLSEISKNISHIKRQLRQLNAL